jgi:hypothetical protein
MSCAEKGSDIDAVGGSLQYHAHDKNQARQLAGSVTFTEALVQLPKADVSEKEAGSVVGLFVICFATF